MCLIRKIVFLLFFCGVSNVFSISTIIIDSNELTSLKENIYIYSGLDSLTIYDVGLLNDSSFIESNLEVPNLGVSNHHHWVKFKIKNNTDNANLLLRLALPTLDFCELYYKSENGKYFSQSLGDDVLFNERKYRIPEFVFDLNLPTGEERLFFLKIKSNEQILVPLSVGSFTEILYESNSKNIIYGIYSGIVLVMFFYNLFLFFATRDKSYLYYILYIFTVGIVQLTFSGHTFEYLWPSNLWLSKHGLLIFGAFSGITIMLFAYEFLQIHKYNKFIKYIVFLVIGLYSIALLAALFDLFGLSYRLIDLSGLILSVSLLFIAIYISVKGYRPATFFLIAWVVFLVGLFAFVFRSFGVLPYNNFTNYTMPIGSAIEVVLLSLALADRINILKKEKVDAQKRELEVLQENQSLIENRNIELEKMVGERTLDLKSSNNELQNTLTKLQKAQVRLVESEKMVSLGQLTAGVAHEINNPINFVLSNVNPLRRDLDDLLEIIAAYDDVKNQPELGFSKVEALKKSLDYDYLKEEIAQILSGIENGAERTSEIVKSLRMFSRLDESDYKKATIEDCIESTLTVLHTKIKDSLPTIRKEFKFTDEIDCYPGKLNQVFMNIISNALDAIEGKANGELYFEVVDENDRVKITIKDNGSGMTEKVKEHIFDPFFTTKDVGKGTGLGMSIVYSIIQDHHGEILVDSAVGLGTTFTIYLPIVGHTN